MTKLSQLPQLYIIMGFDFKTDQLSWVFTIIMISYGSNKTIFQLLKHIFHFSSTNSNLKKPQEKLVVK